MVKIIFLLSLALCSLSSWAFRYTKDFSDGFYWSSLPIQFIVMDTDSQRMNMIASIAQDAVSDWQEALLDNLWNVSSQQGSPVSNRNIIRWSTNFGQETGMSESSTLAVAVRYTGGPYIARGEIIINGKHPINSFSNQLKTVLVHELGHTLGLDHSDVNEAVMAPSLDLHYDGLHYDDIQGMSNTVMETKRRQAIGYVSPLSRNETTQSSAMNCGTIDISGGDGGSGGGPMSLIFSVGIGLMVMIFSRTSRSRRI